jgi:hypothetical protein
VKQAIAVTGLLLLAACGGGGGGGPIEPEPSPPPNYGGTWTGTYIVSSCTNSGFFADAALCGSVLNTTAAFGLVLAQSNRTVTGTFSLGSLSSSALSATIATDGSLVLAAPVAQGSFTLNTTWTLQQAPAGALTGQTRQVWTAAGQSGDAVLQGSIVSAARVSGVRLNQTLPQLSATTLQQLVDLTRASQ